MNTEILSAVYLTIENKPGTLERVTHVLGERRINVDALGLETVGTLGYLRILTKQAREAVGILRAVGVEAFESEIVLASIVNKPRELSRACSELAAAGINIESVVTTPDGRLALRTSDNEMAARILGKL